MGLKNIKKQQLQRTTVSQMAQDAMRKLGKPLIEVGYQTFEVSGDLYADWG